MTRAGQVATDSAPLCPTCRNWRRKQVRMVAEWGSWTGELLYRCPTKWCNRVIYEEDRR